MPVSRKTHPSSPITSYACYMPGPLAACPGSYHCDSVTNLQAGETLEVLK